jgi:hypothetical protein
VPKRPHDGRRQGECGIRTHEIDHDIGTLPAAQRLDLRGGLITGEHTVIGADLSCQVECFGTLVDGDDRGR